MLSHSRSGLLRFVRAASSLLTLLILLFLLTIAMTALVNLRVPQSQRGEFGSDLRPLASACRPLQQDGESNFVIDLLKSGDFREFLRIQGLTNNHALFVLSHGRALSAPLAHRYAYYPDDRLLTSDRVPHYSAGDLARALGPKAAQIHNIVLAGCNREGAFNSAEIRQHFPAVTNIIHTPAGKNGYEFVLRHGLIYPSQGIKLIYDTPDTFAVGDFSVRAPHYQQKTGLSPYVAELFQPGVNTPYSTQLAGRELFTKEIPLALSAHTPQSDSETLSTVLSTAMAAHNPTPALSSPKSIVMLNTRHQAPAIPARLASLCSLPTVPGLDLAFLGLWRDTILCGLLALVLLRISGTCLSLALQVRQPQP